jgi:hypothetical protein
MDKIGKQAVRPDFLYTRGPLNQTLDDLAFAVTYRCYGRALRNYDSSFNRGSSMKRSER